MLLTIFLAIVFCAAISIMLLSAVAFIQDKKFFSSAPKEAQEPRGRVRVSKIERKAKIYESRL